jgi:hypothetical protein
MRVSSESEKHMLWLLLLLLVVVLLLHAACGVLHVLGAWPFSSY